MVCQLAHFEEVYRTQHGTVYQCSRQNCYWLEYAGDTTAFRVSDFFNFKKRIRAIDISAKIIVSSRTADFTLVMPSRTPRSFVLDVNHVLHLRVLPDGSTFMIQLNSLVSACLPEAPSNTR